MPVLTWFGRMGGKSRSARRLIEMFPNDCDVYVEPFLGAGNLLMRVPQGRFKTEHVNDLETHQIIDPVIIHDLLTCFKGKFMLTYNADPFILDLFKDFKITIHPVEYIIGGKHRFKDEVIITNY